MENQQLRRESPLSANCNCRVLVQETATMRKGLQAAERKNEQIGSSALLLLSKLTSIFYIASSTQWPH